MTSHDITAALGIYGHVATVASALSEHVRRRPKLGAERRVFRVDAETSVVGLCAWHPERFSRPTVILLHGLTGNAEAIYVVSAAAKAFDRGFNTVRLNTRNCGDTESLTPTLYHSGLTTDLAAVVDELRAEGHERLHAAGFSMGGNVALKYAGERGAASGLRSVAAVSPPIELGQASAAIDRGFMNAIYQKSFLNFLAALVRRKAQQHPSRYDTRGLRGARNLRTFDDRFIAPCFGFDGADDYYDRASAARYVDGITIPALVLHTRDDSIVPAGPLEAWRDRSDAEIVIDELGGHVGFGKGTRMIEWIAAQALGT